MIRAKIMPGRAAARGSVLIISLLMLLVLTILGVTALSMVTLEERMARSFEHGEIAFQGSETAINKAILDGSKQYINDAGEPATRTTYVEADDPFIEAAKACNGTDTFSVDADPYDRLPNTTLASTVTVTYLGENKHVGGESVEFDNTLVGHDFNINALTRVGSSQIVAEHNRGVYIVFQGSGACTYGGPPSLP